MEERQGERRRGRAVDVMGKEDIKVKGVTLGGRGGVKRVRSAPTRMRGDEMRGEEHEEEMEEEEKEEESDFL
ncbi:hypothetical protein E2C01_081745 [Portunus trituberculatus]|uniref:Uncharacterized protein n=1 Tax=Portunus trituberculatus TaxID=210409 RepID=A0A5B7IYY1_PORTR|nr:hypothetical protein [Portunus trituberculatus]